MGLKLLCVVAHPDDECFAFGGFLALAARRGIESHVLCLTDGQAATNRGESTCAADLGRMRREEFAASCRVLGMHGADLWDYQDAQLEFAPFSHVAERLVRRMRALKPDVVLTFGPDGALNTHPDHSMVSSMTTAAYHWAALARRYPEAGPVHAAARLYHLSTNFFMEDRPAPMPSPWTLALNISSVRAIKQEAFRQHTSQAPLMERTRGLFERYGETEHYTLAATRTPQPAHLNGDPFAGLEA